MSPLPLAILDQGAAERLPELRHHEKERGVRLHGRPQPLPAFPPSASSGEGRVPRGDRRGNCVHWRCRDRSRCNRGAMQEQVPRGVEESNARYESSMVCKQEVLSWALSPKSLTDSTATTSILCQTSP